MSQPYTPEDVTSFFPQPLTPNQIQGVLGYLNQGVIPSADPCLSCEPNLIRKLIGEVQREQREKGDFPRVPVSGTLELRGEFVPAAESVPEELPQKPEDRPKPKPRSRKK